MATVVRKIPRNQTRSNNHSLSRPIALILGLILAGGGVYAYLNPNIIDQAKGYIGLGEPAMEESTATAAQQAIAPPTITDPKAIDALNMAKVWVETRLAKGTKLNEINEAIDIPADQKQFWQSITLNQGAITAIPANSTTERAILLLPMQDQGKLVWACAGDIPQAIEAICSQ